MTTDPQRPPLGERSIFERTIEGVDLSIRADGDGRTVFGLAVPFNVPTRIRDYEGTYDEVFRHGAFAKTIADRGPRKVKLYVKHRRYGDPLGRAIELREDPAGLYGAWRVAKTERGDEVLELVREGAYDAFSIGFRPVRSRWADLVEEVVGVREDYVRDGSVERLEVRLDETSIVDMPAYDTAEIAGVRSTDTHHPPSGPDGSAAPPAAGAALGTSLAVIQIRRRLATHPMREHAS